MPQIKRLSMFLRSLAAILITSGLLSVSSLSPSLAQAQTQVPAVAPTSNQWVSRRTIKTYGKGFSDKRRANKEYGETLFTSSTTDPGLYFSCLDKKFRVGLVFEAQSMSDAFREVEISGVSGNGKFVPTLKSLAHVSAQFEGQGDVRLGEWLYFEDNSAALSRDNKAAKKIYNAVVRGQSMTVTIRGRHKATLSVPKISSTFANFGAECGIGRLKGQ